MIQIYIVFCNEEIIIILLEKEMRYHVNQETTCSFTYNHYFKRLLGKKSTSSGKLEATPQWAGDVDVDDVSPFFGSAWIFDLADDKGTQRALAQRYEVKGHGASALNATGAIKLLARFPIEVEVDASSQLGFIKYTLL